MYAQLNNIGTVIRVVTKLRSDDSAWDISDATLTQIDLKSDDGTKSTFTSVLTSDGLDGKMQYVTVAKTDLNQIGNWKAQGYAEFSDGKKLRTRPIDFKVLDNL